MRLISFDVSRTLHIPGVRYIKPERMFEHLDEIQAADWLLFPSYWQVSTLLHAMHKRIFPSPATYYLGHDKVEQTRAFQAICPENIPKTTIQASTCHGIDIAEAEVGYPMIVKEIRSARGQGVHLIERRRELETLAASQEVLYAQTRLPIDRDLRIVLIGDRILASYWRVTPPGGYRANVAQGGMIDHDDIPPPRWPWSSASPRGWVSITPGSTSPWWGITPSCSSSTACSAPRALPTPAGRPPRPSWNGSPAARERPPRTTPVSRRSRSKNVRERCLTSRQRRFEWRPPGMAGTKKTPARWPGS
ncbi:ATP-grasp domain-containing protein [Salinicola acroporae]|uniref:ATP-grasp domain-containing protein n=1 Tax=Salinicola acroporae TaxID=1541440 RepID=UPI002453AF56|nr:hypothetical protein [Salinicola acroporae]